MRKLFIILAWVVDANGTFNVLSGYPKKIDSNSYEGDTNKALLRAKGDFHEVIGAMCKVDTRKVQSVVLMDEAGFVIDKFTTGSLDITESEPEPTSEPEET